MFSQMRSALYSGLKKIDELLGIPQPLITILCYHSFSSDSWYFSTSPELFESHLTALQPHYDFIALADLEAHILGNKKITRPSLLITIDDGYKSILKIQKIIKKFDVRPTVFILGNPSHANRREMDNDLELLTWDEIRGLQKDGWSFGSHTMTHPNLTDCTTNEIKQELEASKKMIETELETECRSVAYPRGRFNTEVLRSTEGAGYSLGFSTDFTIRTSLRNRYCLSRVGINKSHSANELLSLLTPSARIIRSIASTIIK
jgi:peptidoglycan/xylan/chitin deacetylase (PgdA/CDA1 family)